MTIERKWQYAIWLLPIAALGVALMDMPYGYYQLLRVLVFCVSSFLAYESGKNRQQLFAWIFAGVAITYNPIVKLSLGADVWPFVNVATIALLGIHLFYSRRWTSA